jgi:hypothetical protein
MGFIIVGVTVQPVFFQNQLFSPYPVPPIQGIGMVEWSQLVGENTIVVYGLFD